MNIQPDHDLTHEQVLSNDGHDPTTDMLKVMKTAKGSVGVRSVNGRLMYNLPRDWYDGKQVRSMSGLPDTPANRIACETIARTMELDWLHSRFDPTLNKYRHVGTAVTQELTVVNCTGVPLVDVWNAYVELKRKTCKESTMYTTYDGTFRSILEEMPYKLVSEAPQAFNWLTNHKSADTTLRLLRHLSSACEYAKTCGVIGDNPYVGMTKQVTVVKRNKEDGYDDINPFTKDERIRILTAFKDNTFCSPRSGYKHSFYTDFLEFLFLTGARPGEVCELRWRDIDERYIHLTRVVIVGYNGKLAAKGLKTQERRRFPINSQLQTVIERARPLHSNQDVLVFPGATGGYLDVDSLRKNAWSQVLTGLGIEYRPPYNTRHTFITHALDVGLHVKDVARLVGNSPDVIFKHYAGRTRDLNVPEL